MQDIYQRTFMKDVISRFANKLNSIDEGIKSIKRSYS